MWKGTGVVWSSKKKFEQEGVVFEDGYIILCRCGWQNSLENCSFILLCGIQIDWKCGAFRYEFGRIKAVGRSARAQPRVDV